MKVFKFGGASVNSADAVRNMANIVAAHLGDEPLGSSANSWKPTTAISPPP